MTPREILAFTCWCLGCLVAVPLSLVLMFFSFVFAIMLDLYRGTYSTPIRGLWVLRWWRKACRWLGGTRVTNSSEERTL